MYCQHCGKVIEEGSNYCLYCGGQQQYETNHPNEQLFGYIESYKGFKLLSISEILFLISIIITTITSIILLNYMHTYSDTHFYKNTPSVIYVYAGVLVVSFVLTLIGYILNSVGIYKISREIDKVIIAFYFSIATIAFSFISLFFSAINQNTISDIINIVVFLFKACSVFFILKGIMLIGSTIGDYNVYSINKMITIIIMICFGFVIFYTIVEMIVSAKPDAINTYDPVSYDILMIIPSLLQILIHIILLYYYRKTEEMIKKSLLIQEGSY